ncbi:MAG: response regulator transcription factor [Actinomycetota bacterium]|nr:response regulator transcription factor [Actinomycetota bacterium]
MSIRVLIVDDEAIVRTGLRMILEAQEDLQVVGEATNGREALDSVGRLAPDVILMDIRMPLVDGVEATRQIAAGGAPARVIILTTFDLDEYVVDALRAGASAFLTKESPAEKLVEAVRVVARGEALLAPSVTRRLLDRFARATPRAHPDVTAALATLTEREMEVFARVAKGLSNGEIARELFVSDATVKTHVSSILSKLHLRDRVQAVVLAYESGTVTPGSD